MPEDWYLGVKPLVAHNELDLCTVYYMAFNDNIDLSMSYCAIIDTNFEDSVL